MAGESYLNQSVVDTAREFFKRNEGGGDVVSPHVLKKNYTQEGIIKYFDNGRVPHHEHREYDSPTFIMQEAG